MTMTIARANSGVVQKKSLGSVLANGGRGALGFQINQFLHLIASDRPLHDCSADDKRWRTDQAKLFGKLSVSANNVVDLC